MRRLQYAFGPQAYATCPFDDSSVDEIVSLEGKSLPRMAPNLSESQHAQIRDMILDNCPPAEIADDIGCSERSIFAIKSNLRYFGSTKAPSNGVGRPRSLTPLMLDALCEYLLEEPGAYQYEMVDVLWNKLAFRDIESRRIGESV